MIANWDQVIASALALRWKQHQPASQGNSASVGFRDIPSVQYSSASRNSLIATKQRAAFGSRRRQSILTRIGSQAKGVARADRGIGADECAVERIGFSQGIHIATRANPGSGAINCVGAAVGQCPGTDEYIARSPDIRLILNRGAGIGLIHDACAIGIARTKHSRSLAARDGGGNAIAAERQTVGAATLDKAMRASCCHARIQIQREFLATGRGR